MSLKNTYELSRIHDKWEGINDNPLLDEFNDFVLNDAIRELSVRQGATFLDAGCGVGDHSIRLCRFRLLGIGIDLSEAILARARKRVDHAQLSSRLSLVCGDLEDLPFADNSFDLVHCRAVLMHIPDWKAALAELCRVVKPGGSLVVFENNTNAVEVKLVKFLRVFRKSQSQTRLTDGGIEDWSTIGGRPFVVRIADHWCLEQEIKSHGLSVIRKRATSLVYAGLVPAVVRNYLIWLNRLYYRLHLPVHLGMGTLFMAKKSQVT